jgi:uncharacterized protein YkwD
MIRTLSCCLVMALLGVSTSAAAAEPFDHGTFADRVIELTNAERVNAGLSPLTMNPQLQDAAQTYSEVLASGGCFDHTCGPVPDVADRDDQAGYSGWTALGENIAAGYSTPEAVVAGWMASPGHHANMLSPDFTEIGVGLASGDGEFGTYWTEELGSRL